MADAKEDDVIQPRAQWAKRGEAAKDKVNKDGNMPFALVQEEEKRESLELDLDKNDMSLDLSPSRHSLDKIEEVKGYSAS